MYILVSLPLPSFQTVLARSSTPAWLCCCSSSASCFLGSPLIFIFLLAGLRLSSPPSAAVSGHQWVFFGWKSFKKGLCGNNYSACLDTLAPTQTRGRYSLAQAAQQLPQGARGGVAPVLPHALWLGTVGMLRQMPEGLPGLPASHCRETHCRSPQAEKGTRDCHQNCHRDREGSAFPRSGFFLSNLRPLSCWLIFTLPPLLWKVSLLLWRMVMAKSIPKSPSQSCCEQMMKRALCSWPTQSCPVNHGMVQPQMPSLGWKHAANSHS